MDPKNSGGSSAMDGLPMQTNSELARQKVLAAYSEAAAARPAPYSFAPTASERAETTGRTMPHLSRNPAFRETINPFRRAEHEMELPAVPQATVSPADVIPTRSSDGSNTEEKTPAVLATMPEIPTRAPIYTSDANTTRNNMPWQRSWAKTEAREQRSRVEAKTTSTNAKSTSTASMDYTANTPAATNYSSAIDTSATNYGVTSNSYEAASASHLKDTPVSPEIDLSQETWKKYHTAWQDYYQNYYNNYYSNAARQYIAKERLKDARAKADSESPMKIGMPGTTASGMDNGRLSAKLRTLIRRRATDEAKKTRRIKRFAPLIAGVTVTLTILFMQYNRMIFAPIMAYVSPGNAPASSIEAVDPTITQTISADPRLIIPKLNIDVPIQFDITLDEVMEAMNNGVAHYRIPGASAYPGQVGNFIITGHSAGDVYSSNPYKYIFSGLERLQDGDLIYVNYNSVRYTYKVIKKEVIEPTNVAALIVTTDKPFLTLVTCTPVGTSRYRLLVTAEQISPATSGAITENPTSEPEATDETVLPSNEPTFFENIWGFLTGQN